MLGDSVINDFASRKWCVTLLFYVIIDLIFAEHLHFVTIVEYRECWKCTANTRFYISLLEGIRSHLLNKTLFHDELQTGFQVILLQWAFVLGVAQIHFLVVTWTSDLLLAPDIN